MTQLIFSKFFVKNKKLYIILFLITFFFEPAFAQNPANVKARTVFNIARELKWEKDKDLLKYSICVLADKDSVYNAFLNFKESGQRINGKEIEVSKAENFDDFLRVLNSKNIQILYISNKHKSEADTIFKLIEGQMIMIVTENAENTKYTVVNLINNPDKYYEINPDNARKQHLRLTENILVLGGDENLLRQMYLDSMKVLRSEREKILLNLYQIEDQTKRLDLRNEELEQKQMQLDSINTIMSQQKSIIEKQLKILRSNKKHIEQQKNELHKQQLNYEQQLARIDSINEKLNAKQLEIAEKEQKIKDIDKELVHTLNRIQTQSDYIKLGIVIFIFLLAVLFVFYIRNKEAKKIKAQNKLIQNKNEEITNINSELIKQKEIISDKNITLEKHVKEITDSINYAKRIQLALLPVQDILNLNFKDSFVLYKPREIVSGDFYWFKKIENKIIIAAADCTGHGVPGAFMSVLGMTYLSEITNKKLDKPNVILDSLRDKIVKSLEQDNIKSTVKDGMDMALVIIDTENQIIEFSGAYNPILYVDSEQNITEIKADRMPVGLYYKPATISKFSLKQIHYKTGDKLFLFSDGYKDQLGGKNYKKIGKKQFYQLIKENLSKPMPVLKTELENFFNNWKSVSNIGQTDDVLIIGIDL